MQTFLPYPSFIDSARSLDRQRLGKQRVETFQILRALSGESRGWRNHPAVRMWAGFEYALRAYGRAVCQEWIRRGYNDSMLCRFNGPDVFVMPPWLGGPIHKTHQDALVVKNPGHYLPLGWEKVDSYSYHWPTLTRGSHGQEDRQS